MKKNGANNGVSKTHKSVTCLLTEEEHMRVKVIAAVKRLQIKQWLNSSINKCILSDEKELNICKSENEK